MFQDLFLITSSPQMIENTGETLNEGVKTTNEIKNINDAKMLNDGFVLYNK